MAARKRVARSLDHFVVLVTLLLDITGLVNTFYYFTSVSSIAGKGHFSRSVGARMRHSLFITVPDNYKAPST